MEEFCLEKKWPNPDFLLCSAICCNSAARGQCDLKQIQALQGKEPVLCSPHSISLSQDSLSSAVYSWSYKGIWKGSERSSFMGFSSRAKFRRGRPSGGLAPHHHCLSCEATTTIRCLPLTFPFWTAPTLSSHPCSFR